MVEVLGARVLIQLCTIRYKRLFTFQTKLTEH